MKQYTNKGLFIGFTDKQINTFFPIYKNYFAKKGVSLELLKIDEYVLTVENGKPSIDVQEYDFCVELVKDQYISTLFEKQKKPCFNGYREMTFSDDKFLTFVKLAENDIPMPKTISGNTDFDGLKIEGYERSTSFKNKVENNLGYPFVAKPTFGYGGKGVVKVHDREEFDSLLKTSGQEPYLFQEFIDENIGTDIRVMVVGGKAIFSIMRKNPNSFISNISSGGTAEAFEASKEQNKIAEKVAQILGLSNCAVDFFNTKDGRPLLCEVNANPGGADTNEQLTGINQAEKFVEFIMQNVYEKN